MTDVRAPDDAVPPPARLPAALGTVLGLAVALLLAALPGASVSAGRAQSALGAVTADHSLLATADRLSATRSSTAKLRGPSDRRPDFGDMPLLPAASLALIVILFGAVSIRSHSARAPIPARRPSTTRARAPPRA